CPGPPSVSTTSARGYLCDTYRRAILFPHRFC
ncbi:hypothetical protein V3C99_007993, partial [Haemonchus contortus]